MRKRGFGRKRSLIIAVTVLAISVAAPEMDASAGTAVARGTTVNEMQARPAAPAVLVAKRRKKKPAPMTAARRKALLSRYLKAHPGLVAKKLGVARVPVKKAPLKKKVVKKKKVTAKKKKRTAAAVAAAAKRKKAAANKKRRAAALAAAAVAKKQPKKHPLGPTGWTELLLLALLPFGAVGAVLLGTDRARRPREPRAPSPSKRRRTLVITPMKGRR